MVREAISSSEIVENDGLLGMTMEPSGTSALVKMGGVIAVGFSAFCYPALINRSSIEE